MQIENFKLNADPRLNLQLPNSRFAICNLQFAFCNLHFAFCILQFLNSHFSNFSICNTLILHCCAFVAETDWFPSRSRLIASSIPFMNWVASKVEKRLAISRASLMTTVFGVSS